MILTTSSSPKIAENPKVNITQKEVIEIVDRTILQEPPKIDIEIINKPSQVIQEVEPSKSSIIQQQKNNVEEVKSSVASLITVQKEEPKTVVPQQQESVKVPIKIFSLGLLKNAVQPPVEE